jgi:hypothetical protein
MKNNRTVRLVKSPNSPQGDYVCYLNEEGVSQYESLKAKLKAKKIESVGQEDTQALVQKDLLLE